MKAWQWLKEYGLSGAAASLMMVRVAVCYPTIGWPEAIGLFLCLVVHYGKNYLLIGQDIDQEAILDKVESLENDIQNLESKVSGISLNLGIKSSIGDES